VSDVTNLDDIVDVVPPANAFQVTGAFQRDEVGVEVQDNGWAVLDSPNQIARHARGQAIRADEHMYSSGALGEEHSGLTGGISAPDDDHFFTAAELGLDERRAVVHAGAFKLRQVVPIGKPR